MSNQFSTVVHRLVQLNLRRRCCGLPHNGVAPFDAVQQVLLSVKLPAPLCSCVRVAAGKWNVETTDGHQCRHTDTTIHTAEAVSRCTSLAFIAAATIIAVSRESSHVGSVTRDMHRLAVYVSQPAVGCDILFIERHLDILASALVHSYILI